MKKKVTVNSFKITINLFFLNYTFNKIDRGLVTFSNNCCILKSKNFFQMKITIVKCSNNMGCCSSGFPTSNKTIFDYNHFFTCLYKAISCSKSCQTTSNNYHINFFIGFQLRERTGINILFEPTTDV